MNLLLGVGNEQNGDDGIGPFVAKSINLPGWKGVNCSITPENFTGIARKEEPELLLMVDAADMGLEPGEIRIIPKGRIDELVISTHYMPLSILMRYLSDSASKVIFVGIQPKQHENSLSAEAREAAWRLLEFLKQGRLDKIKVLE
ncbi:MAG: hydrogenase 3 maturation endopeptidase HyCI [Candidatus Diapherotrites archaeon]|nr:hydrogenase 3 maturation endopeptidase HyCI [Candidatus Diapherotrites archaeon]